MEWLGVVLHPYDGTVHASWQRVPDLIELERRGGLHLLP